MHQLPNKTPTLNVQPINLHAKTVNCLAAGLESYVPSAELPWDGTRIQHLYRRISYGASLEEVEEAVGIDPTAFVISMLQEAAVYPIPAPPPWAEWDPDRFIIEKLDPFDAYLTDMQDFVDLALQRGVREKLVIFWHNHFVTRFESHACPSYHYAYFKILTEHAFGNFRELTRVVSKTPAMLFFLNGFENQRESPNENYARELFELFTLGENNGYTQQDIAEASRALTGYNGFTTYCGAVEWTDLSYDSGIKLVFGKTGNYNTDTLIDLLFAERGDRIARFVCGKLYRFYVNPNPDEAVIEQLAETFQKADFELMPVLQQLLTSAHFFDAANLGVQLKSPLELMNVFLRQGAFGDFENRRLYGFWGIAEMGQQLGEPPDVAGWPGNRAWIDANRITLRWKFIEGFSWAVHNHDETTLPAWAIALSGNSKEPEIIVRAIADFVTPNGLADETAYTLATSVFKWDVPVNYYESGRWSLAYETASWQLVVLLRHLGRLPEYQLN